MFRVTRALVLTLVFVAAAMPITRAGADTGREEQDFVARINSYRASHGVQPLAVDSNLTSIARRWSAQMAQAGAPSHNPNLASEADTSNDLGENVGDGESVDWLENAFEQSPEHAQNLLDPRFRLIGVGVVETPHRLWVTQDFETSDDTAAQQQADVQPQAPAPTAAPAPIEAPQAPTELPVGGVRTRTLAPAASMGPSTTPSDVRNESQTSPLPTDDHVDTAAATLRAALAEAAAMSLGLPVRG